jgi:hypothetical protein
MCFFQWLIDHIPLFFPEWLRQRIETFIIYVALCYYEIGAALVIVFGVYWGTLVSIPAVVSALLVPIAGDFWEAIGQSVYVRVERKAQRVRATVEFYVPRVFLWPMIWGCRWCLFWWWFLMRWYHLWRNMFYFVAEFLNWIVRC